MRIGLSAFKLLLPSGKAWRLTIGRQLREFFTGLSVEPGDAQDYQDGGWDDYRPAGTTKLDQWEDQFGLISTALTETERRDRLAATWKAQGGQSPRYLQDTLQNAGFPLFIHEWWVPGTTPPIPRNPNAWISPDGTGSFITAMFGGEGVQFGRQSSQFGKSRTLKFLLTDNLEKPIVWPRTDVNDWPRFLYFSGATFGETVNIPAERWDELRTLLLKICPSQLWVGVFVEIT